MSQIKLCKVYGISRSLALGIVRFRASRASKVLICVQNGAMWNFCVVFNCNSEEISLGLGGPWVCTIICSKCDFELGVSAVVITRFCRKAKICISQDANSLRHKV